MVINQEEKGKEELHKKRKAIYKRKKKLLAPSGRTDTRANAFE